MFRYELSAVDTGSLTIFLPLRSKRHVSSEKYNQAGLDADMEPSSHICPLYLEAPTTALTIYDSSRPSGPLPAVSAYCTTRNTWMAAWMARGVAAARTKPQQRDTSEAECTQLQQQYMHPRQHRQHHIRTSSWRPTHFE